MPMNKQGNSQGTQNGAEETVSPKRSKDPTDDDQELNTATKRQRTEPPKEHRNDSEEIGESAGPVLAQITQTSEHRLSAPETDEVLIGTVRGQMREISDVPSRHSDTDRKCRSMHHQTAENPNEQLRDSNMTGENVTNGSNELNKNSTDERPDDGDLEVDLNGETVKRQRTESSEENCGEKRGQGEGRRTPKTSSEGAGARRIPDGVDELTNGRETTVNTEDEQDRTESGVEAETSDVEEDEENGNSGRSTEDGEEVDEDDEDSKKFTELFFKVYEFIGRISDAILLESAEELRGLVQDLRQISGPKSSFLLYMNRTYRGPLAICSLITHPRGKLALDYVTGRFPFGSRWECPELAYQDRRLLQPDQKYRCTMMHLAALSSDVFTSSRSVGLAYVLLTDDVCVPSLFWTDSLGLCPLHWAVLREDLTLLVYLFNVMRKMWNICGDALSEEHSWRHTSPAEHRTKKVSFADILRTAFELNLRVVGDSDVLYTLLVDCLRWVGLTPRDFRLSDAVYLNSPALVARMLSEGCSVHSDRPEPLDPLHSAVITIDYDFEDQMNVIKLLLDHGANPNRLGYVKATEVVTDNGTPLHFILGPVYGMRMLPECRKRVVHLLLTYGADPHLLNDDAQTCYHLLAPSIKRQFFALVENVEQNADVQQSFL